MRAATQAAWLQVVAAREQLEVRKAVCQFVMISFSFVTVRDGKCALTTDAAFNEQRRDDSHFLFLVKWVSFSISYLEEAAP